MLDFETIKAIAERLTPLDYVLYAVVRRPQPDGSTKYLYPIKDQETALRAVALLPHANPPLSYLERLAVVNEARRYLLPSVTTTGMTHDRPSEGS